MASGAWSFPKSWGYPGTIIHHRILGFSMKYIIQTKDYPHDYGYSPPIFQISQISPDTPDAPSTPGVLLLTVSLLSLNGGLGV